MVNPCPCTTLQRGAMTLAIFDAVISMVNLGLMILALVEYFRYDDDEDESEKRAGIVVVIILTIICIMQVLLAFRLYLGARKRDYRNCRIWLIITTVITTINIINLILNFTVSEFDAWSFGGTLFVVLYKLYEMLVVYFFLQELNKEVREMEIGFTTATVHAYPQPQPPPPYTPYYVPPPPGTQIYTTPQSNEAYPMQQFQSYPTAYPTSINNQSYIPPPQNPHGTTSRII